MEGDIIMSLVNEVNMAVENVSVGVTPTDPAPAINVQNANLVISRVA